MIYNSDHFTHFYMKGANTGLTARNRLGAVYPETLRKYTCSVDLLSFFFVKLGLVSDYCVKSVLLFHRDPEFSKIFSELLENRLAVVHPGVLINVEFKTNIPTVLDSFISFAPLDDRYEFLESLAVLGFCKKRLSCDYSGKLVHNDHRLN